VRRRHEKARPPWGERAFLFAGSMERLLGIACVCTEELVDGANEVDGAWGCWHATRKDLLVGDIVTVIRFGVIDVLVDYVAVEVDAGEEALIAGVGEEASIGQFGGGCLGVTTDGAGSYGDVCAQLELVMQETLGTLVGNRYEDKIGSLAANLEAEAGTGQLNEGRSAPATAGAAADDALAVFGTDDEGSFLEAGDNRDAGSMRGDAVGKAVIGGIHEFVQNCMGCLDASIEFGLVSGVGVGADEGGKQN